MTNQSFDNQVKQKISEHEMPVPPGTWEAIAQKKKKRRVIAWWWVTGIGILLLGMVIPIALTNREAGKEVIAGNTGQKSVDKYNEHHVEPGLDHPAFDSKHSNGQDLPGSGTQPVINYRNQDIVVSESKPTSTYSLPNNNRNTSIQFFPASINKKKKGKSREENNTSTGVVDNSATIQYQPGAATVSKDQQIADAVIGVSRLIEKADLIVHNNAHEIGITTINKTTAADSALTGAVKESALQLLRPKRALLSIDIAVNSFMPVRQQQSLAAISRTTTNPMHTAEYRADKIKTVLRPAFSYGITLRKKINNKVGVGVGLQYAVIKEIITLSGRETNTHYSIVQRLENGGSGPHLVNDTVATVTTGTRTIDAVNSYRYLNVPVSLQYTLISRPYWSLQMNGGIDIGLYARYHNSIGGKLIAENASGPIISKQSNTIKTGFFTGLRYSHYLNKRVEWFAEPYLRFNNGRYANAFINNKAVHQAGISVGLSFNIGKQ